jgi:putative Mn2+ efflux pump MntP
MIKYINGLKEQPYSVPNIGIGYISTWFGLSSIYYSVTGVLVPLLGNTTINTYYLQFLGNMTTTGSILLDCVGLYSIYYGLKIVANELRSPYYHYDEMLRICNDSNTNIKII